VDVELMPIASPLKERTDKSSSKQEGKEIEGRLLFGGAKVMACWF
jgi:hypothetical protein